METPSPSRYSFPLEFCRVQVGLNCLQGRTPGDGG